MCRFTFLSQTKMRDSKSFLDMQNISLTQILRSWLKSHRRCRDVISVIFVQRYFGSSMKCPRTSLILSHFRLNALLLQKSSKAVNGKLPLLLLSLLSPLICPPFTIDSSIINWKGRDFAKRKQTPLRESERRERENVKSLFI